LWRRAKTPTSVVCLRYFAFSSELKIFDPLSHTMVTAAGFASITRKLMKAAQNLTGGKIVFVQEGEKVFLLL
jgi:hypothetical protein